MTEERENKPLPDEEIPQADSAQNAPAPEPRNPRRRNRNPGPFWNRSTSTNCAGGP